MKLALIGYGKMGKTIEQVALQRGHTIVLRITSANMHEMNLKQLSRADVAIEFTRPDSARENVLQCLSAGVNVICGTTGWNAHLNEAEECAQKYNAAFLYASNFSIGVNMFFEINKKLAQLMNGRADYQVTIEETHHTQKKDAPSGTAVTLAQHIIEGRSLENKWLLNDFTDPNALPIISHRIGTVPGTHKITYSSAIDNLEITHTAHNRDGFAHGAVLAAEFILGKKGIFSMQDVLGIN